MLAAYLRIHRGVTSEEVKRTIQLMFADFRKKTPQANAAAVDMIMLRLRDVIDNARVRQWCPTVIVAGHHISAMMDENCVTSWTQLV